MTLVILVANTAFRLYYWLMIARILLSWVPQLANNQGLRPVIVFIFEITEPFLKLFRRLIPTAGIGGVGFDFSPLIAIITLEVLRYFVISLLQTFV